MERVKERGLEYIYWWFSSLIVSCNRLSTPLRFRDHSGVPITKHRISIRNHGNGAISTSQDYGRPYEASPTSVFVSDMEHTHGHFLHLRQCKHVCKQNPKSLQNESYSLLTLHFLAFQLHDVNTTQVQGYYIYIQRILLTDQYRRFATGKRVFEEFRNRSRSKHCRSIDRTIRWQ